MSQAYDLELQVLEVIERMERAAAEFRAKARRVQTDDERRELERRAAELKEQVSCLLPNLS